MYEGDLIIETCEILKESNVDLGKFSGVLEREYVDNTCKVTHVSIIDDQGALKIGKPIGEYFTIEILNKESSNIIFCMKNILKEIIKNNTNTLVCGIGNRDITSDALGPFVVSNTVVTRHLKDIEYFRHLNDVSAISTNVLGRTGIETGLIIKNVCLEIKPSAVVAIDALAARNPSRLGTVIQISNTGITPGSGIGNTRYSIDEKNLNTPVFAIGVPTVITGKTLIDAISENKRTHEYDDIIVTPKDIDTIIKKLSKIIATALNTILNPSLDEDDIEMFLE